MESLFICTGCHTWSECVNFSVDSVDKLFQRKVISRMGYVNYRGGTENRHVEMRKVARKRRLFS